MKVWLASCPLSLNANFSYSAAPMPCAMPPKVMPCTIAGLIIVPQSWPHR